MDILCTGRITSCLAHNARPIFFIYSYSVSYWCKTGNASQLLKGEPPSPQGGIWGIPFVWVGYYWGIPSNAKDAWEIP